MRLQFRLLMETLALTALIWTYADQASYESCASVIAVTIATPPDMVARIDGARADALHIPVKLRGPKGAIRKLEMEKSSGTTQVFKLSIPIADDLATQTPHTQDIREDVARMTAFRDRGLQLEELSRHNVMFTLDRYVNVTLALDTDAGRFGEALSGKPVIEPKQVTARVLESELKKRTRSELRLVIPIEDRLQARSEESDVTLTVPLGSKWEGLEATFQPDLVRITIQLAQLHEKAHLTLIPLKVLMPPDVLESDYQIEWQTDADRVQDIDVRMPIGKRQTLTNTDVRAFVDIEKSDLPGEPSPVTATAPAPSEGWTQREIRFVFPAGLDNVQVSGPPRQVKFRIKKKPPTTELTPTDAS